MIEVGRTYGNNGWLVITMLLPVITNIGVIDDRSWKNIWNNGWLVITSYYQLLQILESLMIEVGRTYEIMVD